MATLEELLREAHSLKGDAGMLGAKDVSTLAHQIEHLLGAIQRGEQEMSPDVSDRLFQGLDALGKLVEEAVTGEPSGINTFYVLASLMGLPPANPDKAKRRCHSGGRVHRRNRRNRYSFGGSGRGN